MFVNNDIHYFKIRGPGPGVMPEVCIAAHLSRKLQLCYLHASSKNSCCVPE